jgi:predicted amidophosphoribosyltransferase
MPSQSVIINDLVYNKLERSNKKVLDEMFRIFKYNKEFKNMKQFKRWLIVECSKKIPAMLPVVQQKYPNTPVPVKRKYNAKTKA